MDSVSPTVFCISETGELIRWFDCSDYMREPSDIAISGKEYFVCDFKVVSSCYIYTRHIVEPLSVSMLQPIFIMTINMLTARGGLTRPSPG